MQQIHLSTGHYNWDTPYEQFSWHQKFLFDKIHSLHFSISDIDPNATWDFAVTDDQYIDYLHFLDALQNNAAALTAFPPASPTPNTTAFPWQSIAAAAIEHPPTGYPIPKRKRKTKPNAILTKLKEKYSELQGVSSHDEYLRGFKYIMQHVENNNTKTTEGMDLFRGIYSAVRIVLMEYEDDVSEEEKTAVAVQTDPVIDL